MKDPYFYHSLSLTSPARRVLLVTPHDINELSQVAKALRIWNPNTTAATIKVRAIFGDVVTLTVPAGALVTESVVIDKVFATGTSTGVVLHAYSD